jgi:hypothetical protein
MIRCRHAESPIHGGVVCRLGLFGGKPSLGTCGMCGKIAPLPMAEWPRWARWLERRRRPGERGIGDTLTRLLDTRGGAAWKRWYKAILGRECGCGERGERMNRAFPYWD